MNDDLHPKDSTEVGRVSFRSTMMRNPTRNRSGVHHRRKNRLSYWGVLVVVVTTFYPFSLSLAVVHHTGGANTETLSSTLVRPGTTSSATSTSETTTTTTTENNMRGPASLFFPPVHVYPWGTPLERLTTCYPPGRVKVLHVLRHAQGYHNVNKAYRDPINLDARLTDLGQEQCQQLAQQIAQALSDDIHADSSSSPLADLARQTQLIVTSPLTRCMQTALLTMAPLLLASPAPPVVALEHLRETVNFNCDRRRPLTELQAEFGSAVDFSAVLEGPAEDNDDDWIWQAYEARLGSDVDYMEHRESAEIHVVADRARRFFQWLSQRPETHVVMCSHAAFLRCLWNFGQPQPEIIIAAPASSGESSWEAQQTTFPPTSVVQTLDTRTLADGAPVVDIPVVQYMMTDGDLLEEDLEKKLAWERYLRGDYSNCELRSMIIAFPEEKEKETATGANDDLTNGSSL